MIYFLQDFRDGPVKIGSTVELIARFRAHQTEYMRPLRILAVMPGGVAEEKALHRRFWDLRFDTNEQFIPAPELFDFIGQPERAAEDPESALPMIPLQSRRGIALVNRIYATIVERGREIPDVDLGRPCSERLRKVGLRARACVELAGLDYFEVLESATRDVLIQDGAAWRWFRAPLLAEKAEVADVVR